MFDHPMIQVCAFDDVPLDRDISLMDECWMAEFETALVMSVEERGKSAYLVGRYAGAAARTIGREMMELSWYPNVHDRFHEVHITLPRNEFVTCVASWQYDYKPIVFVKSAWLDNLYFRSHSVFALVDAINVKKALQCGSLTRQKLIELRERINEIATANPTVAFMSFADSLLLKSNYSVGKYNRRIKYTYQPEKIIRLLPHLASVYKAVLGLDIYAVFTQGSNEYYDDRLLYISRSKNHISFNSLGLPFAQTQAIEHQARMAYKAGLHPAADAYLDETFYHSLRFKRGFDKNKESKFPYVAPMATRSSYYFPVSFQLLADNLEPLS
ncbi:MAG TPA: hypothetical protein DDZ81_15785 [Acetobacteraceae bacterium]|nr:hypothetical protein [Acetobacteraceae bacterium]